MLQLYIHENLVQKILCRQESVMPIPTPMPTSVGSAPKNKMSSSPLIGGGHYLSKNSVDIILQKEKLI